jgi:hypothetical protein
MNLFRQINEALWSVQPLWAKRLIVRNRADERHLDLDLDQLAFIDETLAARRLSWAGLNFAVSD